MNRDYQRLRAGGSDTTDNVKWECYRCHIVDGHILGTK